MFAQLAGKTYQNSSRIKCSNRFSTGFFFFNLFKVTRWKSLGEKSRVDTTEYDKCIPDANCKTTFCTAHI